MFVLGNIFYNVFLPTPISVKNHELIEATAFRLNFPLKVKFYGFTGTFS